jgi:hypothetical protein
MLTKHKHSLLKRETLNIIPSLSMKYTNFSLDSWHMSIISGRCLSPTYTEWKLTLWLSLWPNSLSLWDKAWDKIYNLHSLSFLFKPTLLRKNTTLGPFTTDTPLWVNVSSMLSGMWKSPQEPWFHINPCCDQGRNKLGPIYDKYTLLINASFLLGSTTQ